MTVTIRTFPNKLDPYRFETDTFESGQSLGAILQAQVPNFRVMATPPIEVVRNGCPWLVSQWDVPLSPGDSLDITVRPRDVVTLAYAVVAAVVGGAVAAATMAPPDNYSKTIPEGSPIYDANAQGNRVRLMGIVPELFGTHGTYPCLINPAHRYYYNDDEYLLLMTMVSAGYLELSNKDIFIVNTPISHYSGDIDTQIREPGQDVTGHPAWRNVYTSPEVGSTAGGGSGIELEGALASVTPPRTKFAGKMLTVFKEVDGAVLPHWPREWDLGVRLEIADSPGWKMVATEFDGGGWRDLSGSDILCYWSEHALLHECSVGDYVRYPVATNPNGSVAAKKTGVVTSKHTRQLGDQEFYVISIGDEKGNPLSSRAVPSSLRYTECHFLAPNDGIYRVVDIGETQSQLERLYPDAETPQTAWGGFYSLSEAKGVRITAVDQLSGKPVGPFFVCPPNEVTNEINVDVKFPEGIGYLKDDGNISKRELRMMLQWRATEDSEWQSQEFKRGGSSKDQLGNTVHIRLPTYCRPQFRAYRITGKADDTRTWDTIELVRLKCVLESRPSYADGTTLAVRIRGTNALSRSAENKLFCVPTRKLHVPDGKGGWTGSDYHDPAGMVPTDDIAPVLRYICFDNGLDDSNIGQEELLRLHAVWSGRGDTFAAQYDTKDTFWEAVKRQLAVGYSVPTLEYGQVIPVRDEPRGSYDHMYQPSNMTGEGLKRKDSLFELDDPDGIEVEYFSCKTWKPETVLCLLPGDKGANTRKVKAFGIVDREKAWQFGMRERRMARYVRTEYSWGTEMDGFNSRYLDFVALADDVPGYSQNGQLLDWRPVPGGAWLRLDAAISWQADETHMLALRKPDGRLSGPYPAKRLAGLDEVQIVGKLDFAPDLSGRQEFPLWMFGTAETWSFPARVTGIRPQGTDRVAMTARNYDERVYTDDGSIAPPEGNDPVLGMTLAASGSGTALNADRSMAHFNHGDRVRLSVTGSEYRVRSVADRQLQLEAPDGSAASLSFALQPVTVTLIARH